MRTMVPVQYVMESDSCFIEIPDEMLYKVGLSSGDLVKWIDNNDGSFTLQKVDDIMTDILQTGFTYESDEPQTVWSTDKIEINSFVFKQTTDGLIKLTPLKSGWSATFLYTL